jgi:uncharacterized protein YbaR (Trm112 family)
MTLHPDLLQMLVCPVCKDDLTLVGQDRGLKCGTCHRVYPIRDGIPVMLVSEATVEE